MTNTHTPAQGGRHLVLIDVENLTASPSPTNGQLETVINQLGQVVADFDVVQRIVACSHHAAATVAFAFPRARHLWRSGRDGADLALLEVLENERVAERYDRVTICSGDGIFADMAARLASAGVHVTVISSAGLLARRLNLAARSVVLLPTPTAPPSTQTGA